MTKMNWIPSSKGTALVVLLALSLAAVGAAGAVSVSDEEVRNESQVGETVEETVVVEDPFVDMPSTWTLETSTELQNVSWTVTVLQQGTQVNEETAGGQSFELELDQEESGDEVRIAVQGDTPAIESYSYEPREQFVLAELTSIQGDSEEVLHTTGVHHYTNESQNARQAIDDAAQTINETGATGDAKTRLNQAISSYESGTFDNAVDIAGDAEEQAEQAEQSEQTTQMALYGGIAVVALLLVGGGVYYWQSQKDDYNKLQ